MNSCCFSETHTCIVETVQHRCFPEVQSPEGDGGEQRALRVAGSLQTLQRSGLRAAGHHRLQPVVQDVHHPQGALLGRWAGAGHLDPVPLDHAHPGGVLSSHVGDLCALPRVHSGSLGSVSALRPSFSGSFPPLPPVTSFILSLPPSCPHLLPTCRPVWICPPTSPPH